MFSLPIHALCWALFCQTNFEQQEEMNYSFLTILRIQMTFKASRYAAV